MNFQELKLFKGIVLKSRLLSNAARRPAVMFLSYHSKRMCQLFLNTKVDEIKKFHITNSTTHRLEQILTEEITGVKLSSLKDNSVKCGFCYFEDGLHFVYAIDETGIYLMASVGKQGNKYDTDEELTAMMMNYTIGFIYLNFESDTLPQVWISNLLDITNINGSLLKDAIHTFKRELKIITSDISIAIEHKKDFNDKYIKLRLCYQAFLFIHLAKVIDSTRINIQVERPIKERLKIKKVPDYKVIRVDTLYDETIKSINPFPVSGHFRNQPFGDGRNKTKFIYIDGFMKLGYTKPATKLREHI